MTEENEYEQNRSDIAAMIKDGMISTVITRGEDGEPKTDYIIDSKSAYWRTHNVNSNRFGILAETVEYLDTLADDAQYNMSGPRAAVISTQIKSIVNNVLKKAIDAKDSETLRDEHSPQTNMTDKFLKRSQERIIDFKGDTTKRLRWGIFGDKEAERASD